MNFLFRLRHVLLLCEPSSLTIRDKDAAHHGAKNDAQGDALEAERWHVASCGKGAIFLLRSQNRDTVNNSDLKPFGLDDLLQDSRSHKSLCCG